MKPTTLYKYINFERGRAVLEHSMVTFSKPGAFNDPFDMQFVVVPPVTDSELRAALAEKIVTAIKTGTYLKEFPRPPYISRSLARTRLRELKNMTPKELSRQVNLQNRATDYEDLLTEFKETIREGLENSFVSCFTEHKSNLLMWAHYADCHRGMVLEFKDHNQDEFSFLRAAHKVIYQNHPPSPGTKDQWIDFLIHKKGSLFPDNFSKELMTTKGFDWVYEKEWRLIVTRDQFQAIPTERHGGYAFDSRELSAIYLGCKMPEMQKAEIVELCRVKYTKSELFTCQKLPGSFEIHHQRL